MPRSVLLLMLFEQDRDTEANSKSQTPGQAFSLVGITTVVLMISFFNPVSASTATLVLLRVMLVELLLQFELQRMYLHFVVLCRKCDTCDAIHNANSVISPVLFVVVLELLIHCD